MPRSQSSPQLPLPPAGYGAAFGGVAPLLAALNSSAPGVTVVNIDSGAPAAAMPAAGARLRGSLGRFPRAIPAAAPLLAQACATG